MGAGASLRRTEDGGFLPGQDPAVSRTGRVKPALDAAYRPPGQYSTAADNLRYDPADVRVWLNEQAA